MRVLLLTNEVSRKNGWATVGYYVQKYLGCQHLEIVTRQAADNEACDWETHPAITHDNRFRITPLLRDYRTIVKRLGERHFDYVVCNIEPYLPLAHLLRRHFRTDRNTKPKLILIGHGTYIYHPFLKFPAGFFLRRLGSSVDKLVVPSAFTAAKVAEWYAGPIAVVPWGVDCDLYHPVGGTKRELAFISVGQQKERKGTGYLIAAFKDVSSQFPNSKLYLVGPATKRYVEMVNDLGLGEQIIFTDKVGHDELLAYYSRAICHVLPSVNTEKAFEGYGLVHLEANACGLPTIGSLGTANEEVIVHGETGYLCRQGDVAGLASRMREILADYSKWGETSRRALEHARNRSWEDSMHLLSHVLESSLDSVRLQRSGEAETAAKAR